MYPKYWLHAHWWRGHVIHADPWIFLALPQLTRGSSFISSFIFFTSPPACEVAWLDYRSTKSGQRTALGACSEAGRLLGFMVGTALSGARASQNKKNRKQILGMYASIRFDTFCHTYILNGHEGYKPGPGFCCLRFENGTAKDRNALGCTTTWKLPCQSSGTRTHSAANSPSGTRS